jgi:hypothetical protein
MSALLHVRGGGYSTESCEVSKEPGFSLILAVGF